VFVKSIIYRENAMAACRHLYADGLQQKAAYTKAYVIAGDGTLTK
jgi:hypothetical protein